MEKRTVYKVGNVKHFGSVLAVCSVCALAFVVLFIDESENVHKASDWVLVLFSLYTIYGVNKYLFMPYKISIGKPNLINLKSILSDIEIPIENLKSIKTDRFGYFITFESNNKNYDMLYPIDGMHELIHYLKEKNSDLLVKGL